MLLEKKRRVLSGDEIYLRCEDKEGDGCGSRLGDEWKSIGNLKGYGVVSSAFERLVISKAISKDDTTAIMNGDIVTITWKGMYLYAKSTSNWLFWSPSSRTSSHYFVIKGLAENTPVCEHVRFALHSYRWSNCVLGYYAQVT